MPTEIYVRQPMTPRPQQPILKTQLDDMYSHQPQTPRMVQQSDIYSQPPGTPRPVSARLQLQTVRQPLMVRPPPTSPVDPYARQPGTPIPPPIHDPYAEAPGTPMPLSPNDRTQEGNESQLS